MLVLSVLRHLLGRSDAVGDLLLLLFLVLASRVPRLRTGPNSVVAKLLVALALNLVVLLDDEVRLEAQHPRHTDEREQDEEDLEGGLAGEELLLGVDVSGTEEHVDEHVEQAGRRDHAGRGPVDTPLVDDADDEVAEDGLHEEELGDELGVDGSVVLESEVVGDLQADGESHLETRQARRSSAAEKGRDEKRKKTHVDDSEDDTHFHLVRVGENEGIVGSVPCGVESEGIDAGLDSLYRSSLVRPLPPGLPDRHRLGEDVVVYESSEHREESHKDDDVSTTVGDEVWARVSQRICKRQSERDAQEERRRDFVQASLGHLLLVQDHVGSSEEGDEAVPQVSEHDRE